jgi:hypothetical protein
MFYSEFGVYLTPARASHHITPLLRCYEQWNKVRFVRRVSYDHVVWC